MGAIYKKELRGYLTSPIGYVYLAAFFAISGYYFFATCLVGNMNDLSYLFNSLFTIVFFLTPMLTMRLFSEERKNKTEQVLYTSPISYTDIVMGKFLACITIFFIGLCVTVLYALTLSVYQSPDYPVFWGHFSGMLLLGSAISSLGIFISAQTENQIIAVISTVAAGLILILIDSFTSMTTNETAINLLNSISFSVRYSDFTTGLLNISDILFFISVSGLFLFLTIRSLERRRII